MAPFHLPHNINLASVSVKMAATSVTQRSYCLCLAKTTPRVPVHPRFCFPGGRQDSRTPPIETCQLYWQVPLVQCQLCLEFRDSLFKGLPFRFASLTKYTWSVADRVRGPYCKLRTEVFSSSIYGPSTKRELKREARGIILCEHITTV